MNIFMALNINTSIIRTTAKTLAAKNTELLDTLKASKNTVDSLRDVWTGSAATATIGAYDAFAAKYFESYHQMLNEYVKFLNNVAGAGYETTESKVKNLASEI